MAVTLYIGHQKGSASTTELSPSGIQKIIDAAFHIAQASAEDPCFGLAEASLCQSEHPDLDLYHPWEIEPTQAIELAQQLEHEAFALDSRIVNSDGTHISTTTGCFGYANTHGAEGLVYSSRHSISCSLIASQNQKLQRDYDYSTARDPKNLAAITKLAHGAAQRALNRLDARPIKTQQAPVLFDARISAHLLHCFIQAISGGNLYRRQSFLSDSIGLKLFPDWFHLQEHPYIPGALGSSAWDADGVTTRENIFVDEGKIQNYVLSTYSARRLGLQTTGNAGGVHNLTVSTTHQDRDHLLQDMHTGLYVTELMGDGVNIQTGDYSKGAFGYWVENGQIVHPVEEITLAGHLKNLFLGIQGIGADFDLNRATQCGSILIDYMMIAGTSIHEC